MNEKDIKIGMKVVPFQKTAWASLEDSFVWKEAKKINQTYLYVVGNKNLLFWRLSKDIDGGCDFFYACDFEPYIEEVIVEKLKLESDNVCVKFNTIGMRTPLKDMSGMLLYVGDVIQFNNDGDESIVCSKKGDIMGIWGCLQQDDMKRFGVIKVKSFTQLKKGEQYYGIHVVLDNNAKAEALKEVEDVITYKLIGTTSIVTVNGKIGKARLNPEDEFDKARGFRYAYSRACGDKEYDDFGDETKELKDFSNNELLEELEYRLNN